MSGKLKKVICMMCISMLFLNGCGKSDAITAETKAKVESQTDKALELYADIEKVVEANHLGSGQRVYRYEKTADRYGYRGKRKACPGKGRRCKTCSSGD